MLKVDSSSLNENKDVYGGIPYSLIPAKLIFNIIANGIKKKTNIHKYGREITAYFFQPSMELGRFIFFKSFFIIQPNIDLLQSQRNTRFRIPT